MNTTHYLQAELYEFIQSEISGFDRIQEAFTDGLWVWDLERLEESWISPRFWKRLGHVPEEMPHNSRAWQECMHPEDGAAFQETWPQFLEHPEPLYEQVLRYRHKDGHLVWMKCRGMAIRDEAGRAMRMIATHDDISREKEAEQRWKKEHDLLQSILNQQAVYVLRTTPEGRYTYVNEILCRRKQQAADALLGTLREACLPEEERHRYGLAVARCMEQPEVPQKIVLKEYFEARLLAVSWELRAMADEQGEITEILQVGGDVSAQLEVEGGHKNLIHHIKDTVLKINAQGNLLYASPRWTEAYGYSLEETLGKNFQEFAHPDDLAGAYQRLQELIEQCETEDAPLVHRIRHKEGYWKWIETSGMISSSEGDCVLVCRDVTLRKKQEEELRFQAQLLQSVGEAVVATNLAGEVIYWNQMAEEMYGWSFEEVQGKPIEQLTPTNQSREEAQAILEALTQGKTWSGEFEVKNKFDLAFPAMVTDSPVLDAEGNLIGIIGVSRDMRSWHEAKEQLRQSEVRYRQLVEHTQAIHWRLEMGSQRFTYMEASIEALLGYPAESWVDMDTWASRIVEEDRNNTLAYCNDQSEQGLDHVMEYRAMASDGRIVWIKDVVTVVEEEGQSVELIGFMIDITTEKQTELALKESEEQLKNIVESIPGLVIRYRLQPDGSDEALYISRGVEDIYEIPREEALADISLVWKQVHPDDLAEVQTSMLKSAENLTPWNKQHRITFPDGRIKWIRARGIPQKWDDGSVVWDTLAWDITEEVLVKQELEEQKERLRNIMESIPGLVLRYRLFPDGSAKTIYLSRGVEEVYEIPRAAAFEDISLIGDRVHPDDLYLIRQRIEQAAANLTIWDQQHRILFPDGRIKWVHAKGIPKRLPDGSTIWDTLTWDITQQREAERETLEQREQLRMITENMLEVVWLLAADASELLYLSAAYEKVYGYDLSAIYENPSSFFEFIHEEDRPWVVQEFSSYAQTLRYELEFRVRKPDGSVMWVWARQFPVYDDEGQITRHTGLAMNITARKEAEEMRALAARLEVEKKEMEKFAYFASHDLKEPLRTLQGFISLLRRKYEATLPADAMEYMAYISGSALRMQQLIDGLLNYSRVGRSPVKTRVNTYVLAQSVLKDMKASLIEAGAMCELRDLPVLYAYEAELRRLFQNLISNAIKFVRPDVSPRIILDAEETEGHWLFWVQDNGIGIEKEYHEKIFHMFQRLHDKDEYEGTGLGLASCKKIAELHGGKIWVESAPGEGSTFFFSLKR